MFAATATIINPAQASRPITVRLRPRFAAALRKARPASDGNAIRWPDFPHNATFATASPATRSSVPLTKNAVSLEPSVPVPASAAHAAARASAARQSPCSAVPDGRISPLPPTATRRGAEAHLLFFRPYAAQPADNAPTSRPDSAPTVRLPPVT